MEPALAARVIAAGIGVRGEVERDRLHADADVYAAHRDRAGGCAGPGRDRPDLAGREGAAADRPRGAAAAIVVGAAARQHEHGHDEEPAHGHLSWRETLERGAALAMARWSGRTRDASRKGEALGHGG